MPLDDEGSGDDGGDWKPRIVMAQFVLLPDLVRRFLRLVTCDQSSR